jgi:hypothetical protein
LGASTLAILVVEPMLKDALVKGVLFLGYIVGAAIFSLVAVDYGKEVGMAEWFATACAILVAGAILYMIISLTLGKNQPWTPPTVEHASEVETSNYVPAKPRQYRSMTRRTLNAVKVYKPREHWRVRA